MRLFVQAQPIENVDADWLVVGAFEGADSPLPAGKLGELVGPTLAGLRDGKDFEGKANELLALPVACSGIAARRVMFVGLGKPAELSRAVVWKAAATAARAISGKQRGRVAFQLLGEGVEAVTGPMRAEAIATGVLRGVTGQALYVSEQARFPMDEVQIACGSAEVKAIEAAVARGETIGRAINIARELVNASPSQIYPESFCDKAQELAAEWGEIDVEVLGPEQLAEQKMNCILGVGSGSAKTPRLLVLRYSGASAEHAKTLCLVGKGITFDSGGLSIKTGDGMMDMKCDMAGAATVLATTLAVAKLRLPVNLLTIAPLAENMPSGTAIRPGDVLTAKNGKTIEVLNTDAEGRLVLADALSHAVDLGANHIVDCATLTGACMVALGTNVGGVMANNRAWSDEVLAAAERVGEPAWPLPMFADYDELIKSKVADMKNTCGRWGGAIGAAKLLERFVGEVPWAHMDLAGPAFTDKDTPYQDGGATGYFVRSLIELAERYPDMK